MMKKVTLKRVLDVLTPTSSLSATEKFTEEKQDCPENSNRFGVYRIAQNGFPFEPTCIAYDPVQSVLAIGTSKGCIRILGKVGVEIQLNHSIEVAVTQLVFLVNEGALVSVCADDTIHLWNLRQKEPAVLHSLKFNKERLTFCWISFQSKWIYLGTEKGNVYFCDVESFLLSDYCITWNKAINIMQRSHPGQVVGLAECPMDEGILAVAYMSGLLITWNLKNSQVENRFSSESAITSVSWHKDGKEILSSHANGMLCVWNIQQKNAPKQKMLPHDKSNSDGVSSLNQIDKVEWTSNSSQNDLIIFSGGLTKIKGNKLVPSMTILQGKAVTVLEMDYPVVDFLIMSYTPWKFETQPFAIAILLEQELVVVDMESSGYPCVGIPHGMDIHDSPVTCLKMFRDDQGKVLQALISHLSPKERSGPTFGQKWLLQGGETQSDDTDLNSDFIITGHVDGSLRFWSTKPGCLKSMYKLRTQKLFEKNRTDDCFEIVNLLFDKEKKVLIASNFAAVLVYQLNTHLTNKTIVGLHLYEFEPMKRENISLDAITVQKNCIAMNYPGQSFNKHNEMMREIPQVNTDESNSYLRLRSWQPQQNPGFQVELVCLFDTGIKGQNMLQSIDEFENLISISTPAHLFIVNYKEKVCLQKILFTEFEAKKQTEEPRSPNYDKTGTDKWNVEESLFSDSALSQYPMLIQDKEKSIVGVTSSEPLAKVRQTNGKELVSERNNYDGRDCAFFYDEDTNVGEKITYAAFSPTSIVHGTSVFRLCLWIGNNLGILQQVILRGSNPHDAEKLIISTGSKFVMGKPIVFCGFLSSSWHAISDVGHLKAKISDITESEKIPFCQYIIVSSSTAVTLFQISNNTSLHGFATEETHGEIMQCYLETFSHGTYLSLITKPGIIFILAIPTLNVLYESSSLVRKNFTCKPFCFAPLSQCIFMCSPTEVQRFVLSSEVYEQMQESLCQIFMPRQSPERAQPSIFQTLLGKSFLTLDRNELFGGGRSETILKGTATKYTLPNSNLRSAHFGPDNLQQLHLNVLERGHRLGELEEKTHQMQASAAKLSSNAHNIMLKYKNKKWYQL